MRIHRTAIGSFVTLILLGGSFAVPAWGDDCPSGQYKYCDGDCPPEHTEQGECTTRLEQVGGTTRRWCCCYDDFRPDDVGGETTEGGPPASIGDCPQAGGPKPPESTWAATSAVQQTANPGFTDQVLYLVRDNVLQRNPRARQHVDAVYRFGKQVDQLLARHPKLAAETAALLTENLSLLLKLGNRDGVTVRRQKIDQAVALLEKYARAAGDDAELKAAIAKAQADLRREELLKELGITVQK